MYRFSHSSFFRLLSIVLAGMLVLTSCCKGSAAADTRSVMRQSADFLLSLQLTNGAIPDAPESDITNEDSNMEYALIGLGFAYRSLGDEKYLLAMEQGIRWLASVQVQDSTRWSGSWWYRYHTDGAPAASPVNDQVRDVRGVDTTCALFVYLLALDRQCRPDSTLPARYQKNALSALHFLLHSSMDSDGYTFSSYQQYPDKSWHCDTTKYCADQGDVWLGLQAGADLYDAGQFQPFADSIRENLSSDFYMDRFSRYAESLEEQDSYEADTVSDFSPIMSQGYLPWIFGKNKQNLHAVDWLIQHTNRDGSLTFYPDDPAFAMSAAMLCIGQTGLGKPLPVKSVSWLVRSCLDQKSGGIYDSPQVHVESSNVAAFTVIALSGLRPF